MRGGTGGAGGTERPVQMSGWDVIPRAAAVACAALPPFFRRQPTLILECRYEQSISIRHHVTTRYLPCSVLPLSAQAAEMYVPGDKRGGCDLTGPAAFLHERPCPDELAARSDDYCPNRSVLITAPSESGLDGIGAQRPAPSIATEKNAERVKPWLAPLGSGSHCCEYVCRYAGEAGPRGQELAAWPFRLVFLRSVTPPTWLAVPPADLPSIARVITATSRSTPPSRIRLTRPFIPDTGRARQAFRHNLSPCLCHLVWIPAYTSLDQQSHPDPPPRSRSLIFNAQPQDSGAVVAVLSSSMAQKMCLLPASTSHGLQS